MLGRLIKYDFKWINKVMYVYFAIIFVITLLVKIIESFEQTFLIVIIDKIMSGTFIAITINIIVTCIIRIWVRFVQNIYKDESYLTHTLPVTKKEIFNSKIISSILSLLLSILVVTICIAIIYLNDTTILQIKNMYQSLIDVYNGTFAVFFVIGLILLILLEMICMMMAGIFGIIIGYRANNGKTIKSIITGLGSYILYNIISLIIIMILGKALDFEIVAEGFPSLSTIRIIGLTFIIAFTIYNLSFYFMSKHFLNKGVNVE